MPITKMYRASSMKNPPTWEKVDAARSTSTTSVDELNRLVTHHEIGREKRYYRGYTLYHSERDILPLLASLIKGALAQAKTDGRFEAEREIATVLELLGVAKTSYYHTRNRLRLERYAQKTATKAREAGK